MKVLLISSKFAPEYAGSGLRALNTYKRLSEKFNIRFEVICNSVELTGSKQYVFEGTNVSRISLPLLLPYAASDYRIISRVLFVIKYYMEIYKTYKLLKSKTYDLIHSFGNTASIAAAAYLSEYLKKPMIIELCNSPIDDPHPYLPILNHFIKSDFHRGKVFVAISKELKSVCNKFGYEKNVWSRPNPIDKKTFYVKSVEEKKLLRERNTPFKAFDKVLTYVAKFIPRKNHIFLIDVLNRLPNQYKLVLAGPLVSQGENKERDDCCVESIKKKIDDLKLNDRVFMNIGQVDMSEYLSLSDVFLFPSFNEALGTPMLESFGCGVPVIANNNESAFRQWIKNGNNGFLCELNAEEWAKAIRNIVETDDYKRKRISEDIYSQASSDVIDEGYIKIIRALVDVGYKGEINIEHVLAKEVHKRN